MPLTFLAWCGVFALHLIFVLVFAGAGEVRAGDILSWAAGTAGWALLLDILFRSLSRRGKGAFLFLSGIYTLLGLFLTATFGFAKLYQRPFHWSVIRTDTATIWKENFLSAIYEMGWGHLVLMLAIGFAFMILFSLSRRSADLSRRQLLLRCSGAIAAILVSIFALPAKPGLAAHPIAVSFAGKVRVATANVQVAENDLIPDLDAPESAPFMKALDVARGKKKNVILYFLESTPISVIGKKIQGKELTPNLNKLKQRSLYFNRHYANMPLSINAFYNAFCSAYAIPDGAWVSLALPDFPVPCLSQVLKKQGYRTIGLHAGYLGYAKQKRFMQKRDFDLLMDAETIKKPPYTKGMGPWGAADERSMIRPLTEFAAADSTKPFLAVLFAFAPHHPYDMPEDYPELIGEDAGFKKQQRNFFNSIHFADEAFGTIIAELEKKGLMKDTILIAFGDHGEAFYEHRGNYNHPFFVYEENIRVPLFIWAEGITPQETERITSHVDILPTVLDLLGLNKEVSPMHVGKSMLTSGPERLVHLQAYWHEELSGIVDRRYKFIRKENGERELFDLSADPGEAKNLAASLPDLAQHYNQLTEKAFAQKKAYYKKYANYDLTRFKPSSQDK